MVDVARSVKGQGHVDVKRDVVFGSVALCSNICGSFLGTPDKMGRKRY